MQKITFILVTVLTAGLTFGESVESILKEMADYQSKTPVAKSKPMVSDEDPITESEISARIEKSRDLYAGGEFERAQAGFESVIAIAPENIVARMYLRKLLERDSRKMEITGMQAVTDKWNTGLTLRSYEISSSAIEKMELGEVDGPIDITSKFPEVEFPEGASAVFQPSMEKLFVRNTRDNLTVLEEILDAMDVANISSDVEQVEIEAKFVEISEGTLEELGFKWYAVNNSIDLGGGVQADTSANSGLFDDNLRSSASAFSRQDNLAASTDPATVADGSWTRYRFENAFSAQPDTMELNYTGYDPMDLVISALDQSNGADVLSAPRVVVKSGEEAVIRVGERHTYPEMFEPDASGGTIVHIAYDDWEEKLLGVELAVEPVVDGNQIEMQLTPTVLELLGWQNYGAAPANSAYTFYQRSVVLAFDHDPIVGRLPIFSKRTLETSVVIADGATIAMGGLINEKTESFEDKVPVLGSLPLVGRLFRSEGERSIKRNLMMFVTAKRIEPTGRINTARSF